MKKFLTLLPFCLLTLFGFGLNAQNTLRVGTGETYATITAAYTAANNGDIIQLKAGETHSTVAIAAWLKSVSLVGDDISAIVKPSGNNSFITSITSATNPIVFKDFTIDLANLTPATSTVIPISIANTARDLTFENIKFVNVNTNAVLFNYIGLASTVFNYNFKNIEVTGSKFTHFINGTIAINGLNIENIKIENIPSLSSLVTIVAPTNATIKDISFKGNTSTTCLTLGTVVNTTLDNINIEGNTFSAAMAFGAANVGTNGLTVKGNTITNTFTAPTGNATGAILIEGNTLSNGTLNYALACSPTNATTITIKDNPRLSTITCNPTGTVTGEISITGNGATSMTTLTCSPTASSTVGGIIIQKNSCTTLNCSPAGTVGDIKIGDTGFDNTVGNSCTAITSSPTGTVDNIYIYYNNVTGAGDQITCTPTNATGMVLINYNTLKANTTARASGIVVGTTANIGGNTQISENTFDCSTVTLTTPANKYGIQFQPATIAGTLIVANNIFTDLKATTGVWIAPSNVVDVLYAMSGFMSISNNKMIGSGTTTLGTGMIVTPSGVAGQNVSVVDNTTTSLTCSPAASSKIGQLNLSRNTLNGALTCSPSTGSEVGNILIQTNTGVSTIGANPAGTAGNITIGGANATFKNTATGLFTCSPAATAKVGNIIIRNNESLGITCSPTTTAEAGNITITENNLKTAALACSPGIGGKVTGDITIQNNQGLTSITNTVAGEVTGNVLIDGNGNPTTPMTQVIASPAGEANMKNITITGNTCSGGTTATTYAVSCSPAVGSIVGAILIDNNTSTNAVAAATTDIYSVVAGTATSISITNNKVVKAITCSPSATAIVGNITIYKNGIVGTPMTSIACNPAAGATVGNILISENICTTIAASPLATTLLVATTGNITIDENTCTTITVSPLYVAPNKPNIGNLSIQKNNCTSIASSPAGNVGTVTIKENGKITPITSITFTPGHATVASTCGAITISDNIGTGLFNASPLAAVTLGATDKITISGNTSAGITCSPLNATSNPEIIVHDNTSSALMTFAPVILTNPLTITKNRITVTAAINGITITPNNTALHTGKITIGGTTGFENTISVVTGVGISFGNNINASSVDILKNTFISTNATPAGTAISFAATLASSGNLNIKNNIFSTGSGIAFTAPTTAKQFDKIVIDNNTFNVYATTYVNFATSIINPTKDITVTNNIFNYVNAATPSVALNVGKQISGNYNINQNTFNDFKPTTAYAATTAPVVIGGASVFPTDYAKVSFTQNKFINSDKALQLTNIPAGKYYNARRNYWGSIYPSFATILMPLTSMYYIPYLDADGNELGVDPKANADGKFYVTMDNTSTGDGSDVTTPFPVKSLADSKIYLDMVASKYLVLVGSTPFPVVEGKTTDGSISLTTGWDNITISGLGAGVTIATSNTVVQGQIRIDRAMTLKDFFLTTTGALNAAPDVTGLYIGGTGATLSGITIGPKIMTGSENSSLLYFCLETAGVKNFKMLNCYLHHTGWTSGSAGNRKDKSGYLNVSGDLEGTLIKGNTFTSDFNITSQGSPYTDITKSAKNFTIDGNTFTGDFTTDGSFQDFTFINNTFLYNSTSSAFRTNKPGTVSLYSYIGNMVIYNNTLLCRHNTAVNNITNTCDNSAYSANPYGKFNFSKNYWGGVGTVAQRVNLLWYPYYSTATDWAAGTLTWQAHPTTKWNYNLLDAQDGKTPTLYTTLAQTNETPALRLMAWKIGTSTEWETVASNSYSFPAGDDSHDWLFALVPTVAKNVNDPDRVPEYTLAEMLTAPGEYLSYMSGIKFDLQSGSGVFNPIYNNRDVTSVTLPSTVPTKANHVFLSWNTQPDGGGTSYNKGATFAFTLPITYFSQTLYAIYDNKPEVKINHYVTGSPQMPWGYSTETGAGNFAENSDVTITATVTNPCYAFVGWSTDNNPANIFETTNPYTFNLTEDVTFWAHYKLITEFWVTNNGTQNGFTSTTPAKLETVLDQIFVGVVSSLTEFKINMAAGNYTFRSTLPNPSTYHNPTGAGGVSVSNQAWIDDYNAVAIDEQANKSITINGATDFGTVIKGQIIFQKVGAGTIERYTLNGLKFDWSDVTTSGASSLTAPSDRNTAFFSARSGLTTIGNWEATDVTASSTTMASTTTGGVGFGQIYFMGGNTTNGTNCPYLSRRAFDQTPSVNTAARYSGNVVIEGCWFTGCVGTNKPIVFGGGSSPGSSCAFAYQVYRSKFDNVGFIAGGHSLAGGIIFDDITATDNVGSGFAYGNLTAGFQVLKSKITVSSTATNRGFIFRNRSHDASGSYGLGPMYFENNILESNRNGELFEYPNSSGTGTLTLKNNVIYATNTGTNTILIKDAAVGGLTRDYQNSYLVGSATNLKAYKGDVASNQGVYFINTQRTMQTGGVLKLITKFNDATEANSPSTIDDVVYKDAHTDYSLDAAKFSTSWDCWDATALKKNLPAGSVVSIDFKWKAPLSDDIAKVTINIKVDGNTSLSLNKTVVGVPAGAIANTCTVEGAGNYDLNSNVIISATPGVGFSFTGWSDGNSDNPRTYNLTANTTLTANFELAKIFYVSPTGTGKGVVVGDPSTFDAILPVISASNYSSITGAADYTRFEINATAGDYATEPTYYNLNKPMVVKGANVGIVGHATRSTESIITGGVRIASKDVTIDGFTLTLDGTGWNHLSGNFDDVTVINNIFDNTTSIYILHVGKTKAAPQKNLIFSNNFVTSTTTSRNVITINEAFLDGLIFINNKMEYNGTNQGESINIMNPGFGFPMVTNVTVKDNVTLGNRTRTFNMASMDTYLFENNYVEAQYFGMYLGGSNGTIKNNTFVSKPSTIFNTCYPLYITVGNHSDDHVCHNVEIKENSFYFAPDATQKSAAILFESHNIKPALNLTMNVTVSNNNFVNMNEANPLSYEIQWPITNAYGSDQKILNARENNWFNCTSAPVYGAAPPTLTPCVWNEVSMTGIAADNVLYDWAITFNTNGAIENPNLPISNVNRSLNDRYYEPTAAPVVPKDYYTFEGWFTDDVTFANAWDPTANKITGNVQVFAKWAPIEYPITYTNLKGATNPNAHIVNYSIEDAEIIFVAITDVVQGYIFAGWNPTSIPAGSTGDKTIEATWTLTGHIITATAGTGGTISPNGAVSVPEGEDKTFAIAASAGYSINGITVNGNTVPIANSYTFYNVRGDSTIHATFAPNDYILTFDANSGAGTMADQTFTFGVSQNLTANNFTKTNFNFAGWATTPTGTVAFANNASYTIGAANATLYAVWAAKLPITINETPQSFVYDGTAKTFSIVGATNDLNDFNVVYNPVNPTNAGNFTVTVTRAEDDTYAAFSTVITGGLIITPKPITIATSATKHYDGIDALSLSEISPTSWTNATNAAIIGSDEITLTDLFGAKYTAANVHIAIAVTTIGTPTFTGAGNYAVTLEIVGSITKAILTITAADQTKIFSNLYTPLGTEFLTIGLASTETIGTVTLTSTGYAALSPATTYPITISNAIGGTFNIANYTVTYVNGTLTVAPKTFTIIFNKNDVNATGNMPDQLMSFGSVSDLVKIDLNTFTNISGVVFGGWTKTSSEPNPTILDGAYLNYLFTNDASVTLYAYWTDGTLTIWPRSMVCYIGGESRTGDDFPDAVIDFVGLVGLDTKQTIVSTDSLTPKRTIEEFLSDQYAFYKILYGGTEQTKSLRCENNTKYEMKHTPEIKTPSQFISANGNEYFLRYADSLAILTVRPTQNQAQTELIDPAAIINIPTPQPKPLAAIAPSTSLINSAGQEVDLSKAEIVLIQSQLLSNANSQQFTDLVGSMENKIFEVLGGPNFVVNPIRMALADQKNGNIYVLLTDTNQKVDILVPYPVGTDGSFEFCILHYQEGKDLSNPYDYELGSPKVYSTEYPIDSAFYIKTTPAGLLFSVSNFSPFGIAYRYTSPCPPTVYDLMNQEEYNVIEFPAFSGLCWTKENMRSKVYADNSPVDYKVYVNPNSPSQTYPVEFGYLYTYNAANAINPLTSLPLNPLAPTQGICPLGWRIPTADEYGYLNNYAIEDITTGPWINIVPNNSTGFSALPTGFYNGASGRFERIFGYTSFWSCETFAYGIRYNCNAMEEYLLGTSDAVSVRCVKE